MDEDGRSGWNDYEFLGKLFLELFTVAGLISIAANILIIFVIIKFKKLRQDTTNIIIVHMGILQAIYLLITPLTVRALMTLAGSYEDIKVFCVFNEVEFLIMLAILLLLVLLIFDSFFKLYYEARYVKFRRVYNFFIAVFYFVGILLAVVAGQACFGGNIGWISVMFVDALVAICFIIFLIIMNIIHLVKRRKLRVKKNNTGLCIANIFVGLWLPTFVSLMLLITGEHPAIITLLLVILGHSSPIFNFVYLMCCDNNFNVFMKKVFKCQCNDYSNDMLDQSVVFSEETGVEIEPN